MNTQAKALRTKFRETAAVILQARVPKLVGSSSEIVLSAKPTSTNES